MKKISILDRIFFFITGLLASYQIVVGIDKIGMLAMWAYTIAFGVLLVASLLIIIMGFEVLDSPLVVIVSTIIPLSLSLGLISEHLPQYETVYLIFSIVGFFFIVFTRSAKSKALKVTPVASVHGIAGMTIFLLPIVFSIQGITSPGFAWVGIGGALIGVGGLLLTFLKSGKAILSKEMILTVLPSLLFLMTTAFVVGFSAG